MASKITLKISKLNEEELLEGMDKLVMQLEQRFGGGKTDELLYQLIAKRVKRIYSGECEQHYANDAQKNDFSFNLDQCMQQSELRSTLDAILASIEMQLGSVAAEKLMYQIMYRLGVRNGRYDEEQEYDTDDSDEYYDDEDDAELRTFGVNNENESYEWQPLSSINNFHNNRIDENTQSLHNDKEINKVNEEHEQQAQQKN